MSEDGGKAKIALLAALPRMVQIRKPHGPIDAASRRPKGSSGICITETDVDEPRGLDYPAFGNVRFARRSAATAGEWSRNSIAESCLKRPLVRFELRCRLVHQSGHSRS